MVETEVSLLQALQHRISDRILSLAQHALDLGTNMPSWTFTARMG